MWTLGVKWIRMSTFFWPPACRTGWAAYSVEGLASSQGSHKKDMYRPARVGGPPAALYLLWVLTLEIHCWSPAVLPVLSVP